jgi:hypothetical protein
VLFHDGTREALPPGDTSEEVDRFGPIVASTIGVPYRNELQLSDDEAVEVTPVDEWGGARASEVGLEAASRQPSAVSRVSSQRQPPGPL